MEIVYSWMKDLVLHAIILTVLMEIVPKNSYKKYIQAFVGMILAFILLTSVLEVKKTIEEEVFWSGKMERTTTGMACKISNSNQNADNDCCFDRDTIDDRVGTDETIQTFSFYF